MQCAINALIFNYLRRLLRLHQILTTKEAISLYDSNNSPIEFLLSSNIRDILTVIATVTTNCRNEMESNQYFKDNRGVSARSMLYEYQIKAQTWICFVFVAITLRACHVNSCYSQIMQVRKALTYLGCLFYENIYGYCQFSRYEQVLRYLIVLDFFLLCSNSIL